MRLAPRARLPSWLRAVNAPHRSRRYDCSQVRSVALDDLRKESLEGPLLREESRYGCYATHSRHSPQVCGRLPHSARVWRIHASNSAMISASARAADCARNGSTQMRRIVDHSTQMCSSVRVLGLAPELGLRR